MSKIIFILLILFCAIAICRGEEIIIVNRIPQQVIVIPVEQAMTVQPSYSRGYNIGDKIIMKASTQYGEIIGIRYYNTNRIGGPLSAQFNIKYKSGPNEFETIWVSPSEIEPLLVK